MKRIQLICVFSVLHSLPALACDSGIEGVPFDVSTSIQDGRAHLEILVPKETAELQYPSARFVSPQVTVPLNEGYPEEDQIFFGVSGDPNFLEDATIEISYSLKPVKDETGLGFVMCRFTRTVSWAEHKP